MRQESSTGQDQLTPDSDRRFLEQLCDRFEDAWKAGQRPSIEAYWADIPETARHTALEELLLVELAFRIQAGEKPTLKEYQSRFPGHAEIIRAVLREEMDVIELGSASAETSGLTESKGRDSFPAPKPEQLHDLGRYQVTAKLGKGGFGTVYKAFDPELHREVAVKVPHPHRWEIPGYAETFLREARILASLDHPGIVPVFDVDKTKDGLPFVVSKFIEGMDLRARIKQAKPSWSESVEIVARVAEALHYAHQRGLVHRDIKPANILLDTHGTPVVADFGLALREEDFGTGPLYAGTTAYMSPEQARGEGHLVDARTDVYSLGVVFYELLVGRRPFRANNREELLDLIATRELRPPRQLDDTIPKELDRICLKALSKRASDRYSTAIDFAEDLRHWQESTPTPAPTLTLASSQGAGVGAGVRQDAPPAIGDSTLTADSPNDRSVVQIVPKGLRSFDAEDADFFLDLLPGPRGRDGLPESIQFWKKRLEETDPDKTFRIGLIYGPSGCGKSSLVKAGLLPRLAECLTTIYVEAVPNETESRLLSGLRKRCPTLLGDPPGNLSLVDSLSRLRKGAPGSKKVLIVLDQFEQWLHARPEEQNVDGAAQLVRALRQCDGQHLQCILLVRDDFWMAITRFMRELEISLVENRNSMAVDLFDPRHARKVLFAFGQAFGAILKPPRAGLSIEDHDAERFVDQAVDGLAQDGKIIPVRLALFAEMVKGKKWTPSTLKEVGGTQGIGVRFLEETFNASTAPPQHRLHQKAARAVLQALLPEPGATLKGQWKSYHQLLEASGYARQPREFEELLRILDTELRLVTPTEGDAEATVSAEQAPPRYYQLTHDYLVPALQQWLVRKQQETLRGRAQLRLAERTAFWSALPKYRHLPNWWEWVDILLLTKKKAWTSVERKMMAVASAYHCIRAAMLILAMVILGFVAWRFEKSNNADNLVSRLLVADIDKVPEIIDELDQYRYWAEPRLRRIIPETSPKERLRASLALLPTDETHLDYVWLSLLQAEPDDLLVIRKQLKPRRDKVVPLAWQRIKGGVDPEQRLRLACVVAAYDRDNQHWQKLAKEVAEQLPKENILRIKQWIDAFRPVREFLLDPMAEIFRDRRRSAKEREIAASVLADYGADKPELLVKCLQDSDVSHFAEFFAKLGPYRSEASAAFNDELAKNPSVNAGADRNDDLANRQANAAVALFLFGEPESVWPIFQQKPDPSARSYLIHRLSPLGANPMPIARRLWQDQEPVVSARRALILSLGEFKADQLPASERQHLISKLLQIYQADKDAGMHSAAEWLLRKWHALDNTQEVNDRLAAKKETEETEGSWYINSKGHTMVRLNPQGMPVSLSCGKKINRRFAIATTKVTVEQFRRFSKDHPYNPISSPNENCPVNKIKWFDAAKYCRWLSEQEKIPESEMCYPRIEDIKEHMKMPPDYLRRTGYRLPTEAEWEYACRAGTITNRYFGNSDDLLQHYVWYVENSEEHLWPVGLLKPNDFGLFDMLGNGMEWCQESILQPASLEDAEEAGTVEHDQNRKLRGGRAHSFAKHMMSNLPGSEKPLAEWDNLGFRAVRTCKPQP